MGIGLVLMFFCGRLFKTVLKLSARLMFELNIALPVSFGFFWLLPYLPFIKIFAIQFYNMELQVNSIILASKTIKPYFTKKIQKCIFSQNSTIIKVLYFSIDPVMRVWMSGAQTYFKAVKEGDVFNCFGIGQIMQSNNQNFAKGKYVFGNLGCRSYVEMNKNIQKQCFSIPDELVQMYGAQIFLYLINNGLAAYAGFDKLSIKEGDTVVVSTAAGATGLLLCHLLATKKCKIIGLCSEKKHQMMKQICWKVFAYNDQKLLRQELKKVKFNKYFDNVGQSLLDLIITRIDDFGTIVLCGAIENYSNHAQRKGLVNYSALISKRVELKGITFNSYMLEAFKIFQLYKDAQLHLKVISIEQFPTNFNELLTSGGNTIGKIIVNPHK